MAEYVSKVSKNDYEITFKTNKWSDYREIEEAIRRIIDRNRVEREVKQNENKCDESAI